MNLEIDFSLADRYRSASQRTRVVTESWAATNVYCCNCGGGLAHAKPNQRVLDLECRGCGCGFELKSTSAPLRREVVDGAYAALISRLEDSRSPTFLFLSYDRTKWSVRDLYAVPPYLLDRSAIKARKPLAQTARRSGWIGCSILLDRVPESGKVVYVREGRKRSKKSVLQAWQLSHFLSAAGGMERRGWLLEVMRCIESIRSEEFSLQDAYSFEPVLRSRFPANRFIRAKIRQQLQILRDAGWLAFCGGGRYRRLKHGEYD